MKILQYHSVEQKITFTMSYKHYQKVLDINIRSQIGKPTHTKKVVKKSPSTTVKRRTKTGCLTCRKRKKKCDEDVVNGKCQGCTRNFLQCCWLGPVQDVTTLKPAPIIKTKPVMDKPCADKCSIQSLLATPVVTPATSYNPYPSPLPSPKDGVKEEFNDVKYMALPSNASIKFNNTTTPEKQPRFVITSFNTEKHLCQISC